MEYRYYIGTGPEARALIEECRKRLIEKQSVIDALREKYRAKHVLVQGDEIVELAFDALPGDWKDYLKKPEKRTLNGDLFLCCAPRGNTKRGRELHEEMQAGAAGFSPKDYILERTKTKHMSIDGRKIAFSSAGYRDDDVLLRIPCKGADEKTPVPPAWFREVTASEFMNAQPVEA